VALNRGAGKLSSEVRLRGGRKQAPPSSRSRPNRRRHARSPGDSERWGRALLLCSRRETRCACWSQGKYTAVAKRATAPPVPGGQDRPRLFRWSLRTARVISERPKPGVLAAAGLQDHPRVSRGGSVRGGSRVLTSRLPRAVFEFEAVRHASAGFLRRVRRGACAPTFVRRVNASVVAFPLSGLRQRQPLMAGMSQPSPRGVPPTKGRERRRNRHCTRR